MAGWLGGCAVVPTEKEPPVPGCETRGESVALGMRKGSPDGVVTASLVDATPIPPLLGENLWTVEVLSSGEPVLDANPDTDSTVIANVYMADHDHNIRKEGVMTSPGVFEFPPFLLNMNGYWEITVAVEPDTPAEGAEREEVVFGFCIES